MRDFSRDFEKLREISRETSRDFEKLRGRLREIARDFARDFERLRESSRDFERLREIKTAHGNAQVALARLLSSENATSRNINVVEH